MSELTLQQALDRDPGYRTTAENLMADRIKELEDQLMRTCTPCLEKADRIDELEAALREALVQHEVSGCAVCQKINEVLR